MLLQLFSVSSVSGYIVLCVCGGCVCTCVFNWFTKHYLCVCVFVRYRSQSVNNGER